MNTKKITDNFKIGIYSPYINTFGGGEKYLFNIAQYLSRKHDVSFFSEESVKQKVKEIFNINLDRVHFLSNSLLRTKNLFNKYLFLRNFDIFFFMTDGSVFFPLSGKNFLIIQSPAHIPSKTIVNRFKFIKKWKMLCYSNFIRSIIKKRLSFNAQILAPCIDPNTYSSKFDRKDNIILTVGRFFPRPHNKKQDLLIDIFKSNYKQYFKGWKLVIAGGLTEEGGKKVLEKLKHQAVGYPIEILVNLTFNKLVECYRSAKLYWHATGLNEDLDHYPERAEHFGITTLEAMAAGTVPLVYDAGGQKDIVVNGTNGYLWKSNYQLIRQSSKLIRNDRLLTKFSDLAVKRAQDFSCEHFYAKLEKIIS